MSVLINADEQENVLVERISTLSPMSLRNITAGWQKNHVIALQHLSDSSTGTFKRILDESSKDNSRTAFATGSGFAWLPERTRES